MHRRLELDIGARVLVSLILSGVPAFARGPLATDAPIAPHAIAPHAIATAARSTHAPCFFRRDWRGGFRVTPDARTIYIRVSGSVYRLDLQSSYSVLKDPFAVLSNRDSSNAICTPLDFRLTVSNRAGVIQWPIVKRMTRLTPAQAAALPKKLRP
ncbi:MAG: hypothetical protein ACREUT_19775 [Steroidobacteraceae bacterium]